MLSKPLTTPGCGPTRYRRAMTLDQLSTGLPDDAFITDGLLTKRPLRAFALALLAPRPGELLWDLGAGTGSIAIEWCRLGTALQAVAVERQAERAHRITENASAFGLSDRLDVVITSAEEAIVSLPRPDAVFFGGGIDLPVIERARAALRPGGRLVAHAVTIETERALFDAVARWGGELTRIAVEHAEPIGGFTGFKPARTVTCWGLTVD